MSSAQRPGMLIGAFAATTGVSVETVRYYERRGLLQTSVARLGRGRRYEAAAVSRVMFIKAAQRLGFTLDEVAVLLLLNHGGLCRETRQLADVKLQTVREKLSALRTIEDTLADLVDKCDRSASGVTCPLIAALSSH